eukprot:8611967-Pyramimonas_sp.AAC.1
MYGVSVPRGVERSRVWDISEVCDQMWGCVTKCSRPRPVAGPDVPDRLPETKAVRVKCVNLRCKMAY